MSKVRMPFGKYKGDLLSDIPSAYLVWFVEQNGPADDPLLKRAMAMELLTRLMPHTHINPNKINPQGPRPTSYSDPQGVFDEKAPPRVTTSQKPTPPPDPSSDLTKEETKRIMLGIVDSGYRTLAKKNHPDVGGSAQAMHRLTACADAIRAGIRAL